MLREIRASNFLLFRTVELSFQSGMHTITGETGAGKSLFIRLLRSLSGCYRAKEMLGPFEERFSVEGVFDLDADTNKMLDQEEIPTDDQLILGISGTSERFSARINGVLVPAQTLAQIHAILMEIHSQQAQQNLMDPIFHTHLIDHFGSDIPRLLSDYQTVYERLQESLRLLNHLPGDPSEIARKTDFLQYQIQEIEAARIQENEDEAVEKELQALQNYETLKTRLIECHDLLLESHEGSSVQESLGSALDTLGDVSRWEVEAEIWSKDLSLAQEMIQEAGRAIKRYVDGMDFDEHRMNALEERFSLLQRIKKKYGPRLDDVLAFQKRSQKELDHLNNMTQQALDLDQTIQTHRTELEKLDQALREARKKTSQSIEALIAHELTEMKMDRVRFGHRIGEHPDFQSHGKHWVEFIAAPNPGMPLQPIAKSASGGELSRIFLAIEMSTRQILPHKTIVFDEVDSGIGGRLGDVVGDKLRAFSQDRQVFVVTHLPQVAARADHHLKVDKVQSSDRTESTIAPVEGQSRDQELQEMLGKL
jgi:DNA repair protein RecN (Recombination protein N)